MRHGRERWWDQASKITSFESDERLARICDDERLDGLVVPPNLSANSGGGELMRISSQLSAQ
jgi:hypothetical protein